VPTTTGCRRPPLPSHSHPSRFLDHRLVFPMASTSTAVEKFNGFASQAGVKTRVALQVFWKWTQTAAALVASIAIAIGAGFSAGFSAFAVAFNASMAASAKNVQDQERVGKNVEGPYLEKVVGESQLWFNRNDC
jgi:hypothetical protein